MKNENLEIERKFLLKKFPLNEIAAKWSKSYTIEQYYVMDGGTRKRIRRKIDDATEIERYYETEKTFLSPGVFEEIENEITKDKALKLVNKNPGTVIEKDRFVIHENGLIWELDRYRNIDLVILEVELDDINQEIEIPDIFADLIIMEVTGMEEFSNFSLSVEY